MAEAILPGVGIGMQEVAAPGDPAYARELCCCWPERRVS
jgi:hypothetical protein